MLCDLKGNLPFGIDLLYSGRLHATCSKHKA
jgi:hypothetical protein